MMMLMSSLPRIEEHRVSVVFDCPHCQAERVRGTAYDLRETIRMADHVPLWGWSSHWVRCSNCRTELHANVPSEKLHGALPVAVNTHVRTYLPFPQRFLAIASLLLGWTPVVGVIVAIISMATSLRTRGWPRVLSVVALVLATALNVAMFVTVLVMTTRAGLPTVMGQ